MPFRERLRKTFSRGSSSSSTSSKSSSTSSDSSDRSSSIWYQPGEKIPYKYRRPVDPAHQKKLDSFTFEKSWRRRSHVSQYSPMGSRLPSRAGSIAENVTGFKSRNNADPNDLSILSAADHQISVQINRLSPIESVSTTRMELVDSAGSHYAGFSQSELDDALKKAR